MKRMKGSILDIDGVTAVSGKITMTDPMKKIFGDVFRNAESAVSGGGPMAIVSGRAILADIKKQKEAEVPKDNIPEFLKESTSLENAYELLSRSHVRTIANANALYQAGEKMFEELCAAGISEISPAMKAWLKARELNIEGPNATSDGD